MEQQVKVRTSEQQKEKNFLNLPIHLLDFEEQVRKQMDEVSLGELALSISEVGVLSPILVCRKPDGRFKVITGHRRVLAAKMANLKTVPATIIDDIEWEDQIFLQLAENIQREELHPLDEARALQLIRSKTYYTHFEIAQKIGKDRSYVTKMLSLTKLFKFLDKYPQIQNLSKRELFALASGKSDEEIEKKLKEKFNPEEKKPVAVKCLECGSNNNVKLRIKSNHIGLDDVEDEKLAFIGEYLTELFGWWHKIKITIEVD